MCEVELICNSSLSTTSPRIHGDKINQVKKFNIDKNWKTIVRQRRTNTSIFAGTVAGEHGHRCQTHPADRGCYVTVISS